MTSQLERLADLAAEPPDSKEIRNFIKAGAERLRDSANPANSLASRFDLAYNASHALCLAALRIKGFRPKKRYIVYQVLPLTLGLGPDIWRILARGHDLRNKTEYEGSDEIDEKFLNEMISACEVVSAALGKVFAK